MVSLKSWNIQYFTCAIFKSEGHKGEEHYKICRRGGVRQLSLLTILKVEDCHGAIKYWHTMLVWILGNHSKQHGFDPKSCPKVLPIIWNQPKCFYFYDSQVFVLAFWVKTWVRVKGRGGTRVELLMRFDMQSMSTHSYCELSNNEPRWK